jgi:hypothetical protein
MAAPSGIKHVFVNGVLAAQEGKLTGVLPGKIIAN